MQYHKGSFTQRSLALAVALASTTLTANGIDALEIKASLFDAARNPSAIDNIPVTFIVGENSSGVSTSARQRLHSCRISPSIRASTRISPLPATRAVPLLAGM